MRTTTRLALAATTALAAAPALAQEQAPAKDSSQIKLFVPAIEIANFRPNDQRGINVFEAPKDRVQRFNGFRLNFGAAFTQQFQGLDHENTAAPRFVTGSTVNQNQLITVGNGFNNAVANAYVNGQLARGIRVALTAYLSSRHHNETWVKDGYLLIDDAPFEFKPLNDLMQFVTVKAGHFEINYGDTHFRRTDNGQALYNPLVGNYILDAFTTSVGGEVYLRGRGSLDGAFVMGGITNGEVRGMTLNPSRRSPAFLAKVGIDRQVTPLVRGRLTGSLFSQARAANQTLYSGDRAGSRYYNVLENTLSTETANFQSGAITPFSGPSLGLHAAVINPFVKVGGLEYFGNFERARGRGLTETVDREVRHISNELTYRFLDDRLYVSGRYNTLSGRLAGIANDVDVKRSQFGGGWFILPTVMMKGEYVNQRYENFPTSDIRNGGRFKGFVVEAVVAF